VSAGDDGTLGIWDGTGGGAVLPGAGPGTATAIALVPGADQLIVAGRDARLRVWDLAQQRCVRILDRLEDAGLALTASTDGRTFASFGLDLALRIWDLSAARCIWAFRARKVGLDPYAVTADKNLAIAVIDHDLCVMRPKAWDCGVDEQA